MIQQKNKEILVMANIEKIDGEEQVENQPVNATNEKKIDLTPSEKELLGNLHGEIQNMLHELGCLEMDFDVSKTRLKNKISEQKSRLDLIIHDKIVLSGYKNAENLDIKIDFDNSQLKFTD